MCWVEQLLWNIRDDLDYFSVAHIYSDGHYDILDAEIMLPPGNVFIVLLSDFVHYDDLLENLRFFLK